MSCSSISDLNGIDAEAAKALRSVGIRAELLHAAGVKTVRDLKYRNPAMLAKRMADTNKKRKLVRVLPSDKAVVRWVDAAKKLNIKIKY